MSRDDIRKLAEEAEANTSIDEEAGEKMVYRLLDTTEKGAPYQTITNCAIVLQNDNRLRGRFGYDRFTLENTVELPVPWDQREGLRRPIEKHDQISFAMYAEGYGLTNSKKSADALHVECHANEYDSAQQFFESLKYKGEVHREDALTLFLGVEPTPYTRAVSKLAFNAVTMRVMRPGCKFDCILALTGAQGIGKSQFAKRLALRLGWFVDHIGSWKSKSALEALRAKLVYEMAELSDVKSDDRESVKAWVTSQVDTYRAPYDIRTKDHPRRFIIVATTNEGAFLDDPTGARRWLPVKCDVTKAKLDLFDDALCEEWFTQAYAEAMKEYRGNGGKLPLVLPDELLKDAEEAQEAMRIEDPNEGLIAAYMKDNPNVKVCTGMVIRDIYHKNDYPARDIPSSKKVATILNGFDWIVKGDGKMWLGEYGSVRWWMYEPE